MRSEITLKINEYIDKLSFVLIALLLPTITTAYVITVYSPFFRPIWFDEFLQFAFGGTESLRDALKLILVTSQDINHGQTGTLSLLQQLLIKLNIPTIYALRGPSVIATWIMFLGCILTFRAARLNLSWGIFAALLVATQPTLSFFSAEARPYIFLCASISLTLAYYVASLDDRQSILWKFIGYFGIFSGSLFHPYFLIYWAVICISTAYNPYCGPERTKRFQNIITHTNPGLIFIGITTYLLIGSLTWLKKTPSMNFNSFQWLKRESFITTVLDQHILLYFNLELIGPLLTCSIIYAIGMALFKRKFNFRKISHALLLLLLSLLTTLTISWISYKSGYWILPRQWVGSLYLMPVALILLVATLFKEIGNKTLEIVFPISLSIILVISIWPTFQQKIDATKNIYSSTEIPTIELTRYIEQNSTSVINWLHMADENYPNSKRQETQNLADTFVLLSNRNIISGNKILPIFSKFYCTVQSVRSDPELHRMCIK